MHITTATDRAALSLSQRTIEQALTRLRLAKIGYVEMGKGQYRVAGTFDFWPAVGFWKHTKDTKQGYGVGKLIAAVLPSLPSAEPKPSIALVPPVEPCAQA